jgi:restriction system protein
MACTATIGIMRLIFILMKTSSTRRKRELLAKKNLIDLSPIEFEKYVALIFQRRGYRTKLCGGTGDQGIDIEARRKNEYIVIQCKRYAGNVPSSMVREFGGVLLHENPTKGYLVTTGDFTPDGWAYARGKSMELVNLDKLIHWQQELKIGPYAEPVQESRLSTVTGFSLGQWIVLIALGLSVLSMLGLLIGVLVDNF